MHCQPHIRLTEHFFGFCGPFVPSEVFRGYKQFSPQVHLLLLCHTWSAPATFVSHLKCTCYFCVTPEVHVLLLCHTWSAPATFVSHLKCSCYFCVTPEVHLPLLCHTWSAPATFVSHLFAEADQYCGTSHGRLLICFKNFLSFKIILRVIRKILVFPSLWLCQESICLSRYKTGNEILISLTLRFC